MLMRRRAIMCNYDVQPRAKVSLTPDARLRCTRKENLDTTSSAGRLQFHIFGALAEFERDLNRERTMAGLRAARARGRTGGRPRALSEEDLPELQALMRDPDVPVRRICERFEISKATLYRYVGPDGERRYENE